MVVCLEQGADLHMAQLMPLPLTVSCFSKIQIGFTFLVLAHLGSPEKGPLNRCVCVFVRVRCTYGIIVVASCYVHAGGGSNADLTVKPAAGNHSCVGQ